MPLDSSMYLQQQAPDILGNVVNGMKMSDLIQNHQETARKLNEEQAVRDAYKNNVVTGDDGQNTLDKPGLLSDLASINPQRAMQTAQQWKQQDRENESAELQSHIQKAGVLGGILGSAKDQPSYDDARTKAIQLGLVDPGSLPAQYDPNHVQSMATQTQTLGEQLAQQWKQKGYDQENRKIQAQRDETMARLHQSQDEKNIDRDRKDAEALDKHLSTGWTQRSGQAGSVQGKIIAAEAAEKLGEQIKNQPGGADSRQIEELAQSATKMLGGSAGASARVEALVPHTGWGKVQSLKEWLSNQPQGQDAQAFTDRILETVAREKDLANTQMRQYQVEGLPAHTPLKNRNPDLYNSILRGKGIDSSMIDQNGRYLPPAASSAPASGGQAPSAQFAPDVMSYAQTHGISPQQAQSIKDQRSGQ